MAYDGYPTPPSPGYQANISMDPNDPQGYASAPPYPSYHESEHLTMPQPQIPTDSSNPILDPYAEQPRPNMPPNMASGNINDAVSSAVHNANSSSYLSPDVLSQITATVIQQLKVSGLNDFQSPVQGPAHTPAPAPAPAAASAYQYPPPPPRPQSQQPPWGYTGPELSPRPHSESPTGIQRGEAFAAPNIVHNNYEPAQPYPPYTGYANEHDIRDARPNANLAADGVPQKESVSRSQSVSSQGSQNVAPRPKGPPRDTTVVEMTTLERIWGKLFEDGKPTKRLGQFLRGIALHLIEDYPPGNTLVITPAKLQKFYADTAVPDDYPWHHIFDDHTSSISRMLRGVQVEHHLVQTDDLKERPDIPALTPRGFEQWATIMIQSFPDREYERLQKAVLNMPISNPDDRKERFPKEIPRRLFPDVADLQLREKTGEHILEHCGVNLPRITDEERAQAQQAKKSDSTSSNSTKPAAPQSVPKSANTSPLERTHSYERGRPPAPPANVSTSAIIDDEEEVVSSTPIERERKPYSANPGGGKQYDEHGHSRSHTDSFSKPRPEPLNSSHRPSEKYDRGRESLYARSGSGPAPARRFSRGSRSSSRGVKNHSGDYRHSASDLLDRDPTPRYSGISNDFYSESPVSLVTDVDDPRRHRGNAMYRSRDSRDSRDGEEYYRGMAGGQGGGSSDYKYYH